MSAYQGKSDMSGYLPMSGFTTSAYMISNNIYVKDSIYAFGAGVICNYTGSDTSYISFTGGDDSCDIAMGTGTVEIRKPIVATDVISASSLTKILTDGTDLSTTLVNISASLGSKISSKSSISVDGQLSDLEVQNVDLSVYEELAENDETNPNCIYVTNSDYNDMYGERIVNVGEAINGRDAVPLSQIQRNYVSKSALSAAISALNS